MMESISATSREKKLTPKMQEFMQQEISKKESKYFKLYESWKEQVRTTRTKLKDECCDQDLCDMMDSVEGLETQIKKVYELIRSQSVPSTEIRRKMDSCTAVTTDLMGLMKVRMSEVGQEEFDANAESARIHMVLDKEYAQSIFGTTSSKSTIHSHRSSCSSGQQSITAKRAEFAAQLAAKQAEIKMEEAIATQKQELKKLENERDLQVIAAKLKAYSDADSGEFGNENRAALSEATNCPSVSSKEMKLKHTCKNIKKEQTNHTNSEASVVQALHDTMVLSRLPTPEPSVFSGEPLKFLEWRTSFKALIERRCTNPVDKLFYLQKYLSGEAQTVLEGSFYRKDVEAYDQAWELLNSRYGHPFVIQRAFREKLNTWPKIGSRESVKLRQFSDFLTACSNAMPHIKGLQVLNDCEENQRMLKTLPDWVTSRWNRHVTMQLRQSEEYPNFKEFAEFMAQEAEIACNPVTSFHALKLSEEKPSREVKNLKANAFITDVEASDKSRTMSKTYSNGESNSVDSNRFNKIRSSPLSNPVMCRYCGENHFIHKCRMFASKPMEDKRRFILDNSLCFGCLRRGHNSKDCKIKATCSICKKHHPTPLHEDRPSAPLIVSHATQTEENTSSLSCCLDKGNGGSTSMIVPVWISSTTAPEQETLVYALLDTQSSNTFVDQEICKRMGAILEPVKLKLTTMMGKDSVVQSERVSGLRVRGFSSHVIINLPPVYTRDFIPLERSHIPAPETARRWNHLNNIAEEIPNLLDCKVGLLIGYDCSRALAPRQVITGGDDEPYAIKTDLGWSIVGCSTRIAKLTEVSGLCHHVSVNELPIVAPASVISALESDFKGASSKKKRKHKKNSKKRKKEKVKRISESKTEVQEIQATSTVCRKEIPTVPKNKFIMRKSPKRTHEKDCRQNDRESERESNFQASLYQRRLLVTRSERKIKQRGPKLYGTPSRSRSRDHFQRSETPPHWRQEMQRTQRMRYSSGECWIKGDKSESRNKESKSKDSKRDASQSKSKDSSRKDDRRSQRKSTKHKSHKRKHSRSSSPENRLYGSEI